MAAPAKPKSRFALQREREAAERARGNERFTLDLDESQDYTTGGPRLVGEIIEHASSSDVPLPPTAPGAVAPSPLNSTGFPSSSRLVPQPTVATLESLQAVMDVEREDGGTEGLLSSVSRENEGVLAGMSEREIMDEQREIRESMGLSEGVIRMLEARGRAKASIPEVGTMSRRTRVDPKPHVPPTKQRIEEDEEEGSPEYIRRHFFPNEPVNPNLDWMRTSAADPSTLALDDSSAALTFDIQGTLLPTLSRPHGQSSDHHVSSSSDFTVPSLLSLTSSAVPSQRSTSFLILARIVSNPASSALFVAKKWSALIHACVLHSGRGIRDSNLLVSTNAITLLSTALSTPLPVVVVSKLEGAEQPPDLLATFLSTDPYPPISSLLSLPLLSPASLSNILHILTTILNLTASAIVPGPSLVIEELVACPFLLERLSTSSLSSPLPALQLLQLLTLLSKSSRSSAHNLVDRGLVDPPMRFLAILPWTIHGDRNQACDLLTATLEYWESLARYGLGTGVRTKSAGLLIALEEGIRGLVLPGTLEVRMEHWRIIEAWFGLARMWTVAAVDPHVVGHDIIWTQVEDWKETALVVIEYVLAQEVELEIKEGKSALASAWELLEAWVEGSKVNKVRRGEVERKWVLDNVGCTMTAAMKGFELVGTGWSVVSSALTSAANDDDNARVALAAIKLVEACDIDSLPPSLAPESPVLPLHQHDLMAFLERALREPHPSPMVVQLILAVLANVESVDYRLGATFDVLGVLRAGDEVVAKELVHSLLTMCTDPNFQESPPGTQVHLYGQGPYPRERLNSEYEDPSLAKLLSLTPFITHAIIAASGGRVVSPFYPTPKDIKLTASQQPFASTKYLLPPDWALLILDELLRSGASPVFKNLPAGWDASELKLVRSALVLMRISLISPGNRDRTSAPTLLYGLIKVFMLEKDIVNSTRSSSKSDLFRDPFVDTSLTALLLPLSLSSQPQPQLRILDNRPPAATIEGVSSLVSSAPFYTLYTDLLGLYDSISLGHRTFAQLLLPPLAMSYPIDYRKLLWIDYSHLLRTIRINIGAAISDIEGQGSTAGFYYPIETDQNLLLAYTDALVSGKVTEKDQGFLYSVALHHVAHTILGEGTGELQRSLARVLVEKGFKKVLVGFGSGRNADGGEMGKMEGGEEERKFKLDSLL